MRILLALLLFVPAAVPAGQGAARCQPVVENGWVRMAPRMPMGAAFMRVRNPCRAAVEVVGASSPAFADVSLHETRVDDGVSRMRAVPTIAIGPGQSVELRPGGLHAMLMEPRAPVQVGGQVTVVLELRDGRRLRAELPVRATAP